MRKNIHHVTFGRVTSESIKQIKGGLSINYQLWTFGIWELQPKCFQLKKQVNRKRKVSTWSLKASPLVVLFRPREKELVFTSQSGESRLPLCCNWRLYSHWRARTQAVIESTWGRTGSGPEGSCPTETQRFHVEQKADRFFEWKKFTGSMHVSGVIQSFQRLLTISTPVPF